jgi:hypothetical protein
MRYVAVMEGVSVSASQALFELVAPSNAAVELVSVRVSNETSETPEQLAIALRRGEGSVTAGSGGTTVTPVPIETSQPAYGGTVNRNVTTPMAAGTGAIKVLHREGWNVVGSGLDWRGRIVIRPGDRADVLLVNAPAAAITLSAVIEFETQG